MQCSAPAAAAAAPEVTNPRLPVPGGRQPRLRRAPQPQTALASRPRRRRPGSDRATHDHSEVRAAVAHLTVEQRAVVYLAYWEDLPERAIAELLDLSPGTVHRTLQRARDRLREALR